MNEPERASHRDDESAEFDRRFSEIVAGFGPSPVDPNPESGAELSSQPSAQPPEQPPPSRDHDIPRQGDDAPGQGEAAPWRTCDGESEEGHFTPAPTEPLPAGDLHFWGIVLGLTIGPVLIFLSAVVSALPTTPWGVLGIAATILGFVLLVLRSPNRRSGDDGSGARV